MRLKNLILSALHLLSPRKRCEKAVIVETSINKTLYIN